MFNQNLSMNNSKDFICNSLHLVTKNDMKNINDIFLLKNDAAVLVGIAPETLNTLQEIAQSINNDNNFFQTIDNQLNFKRNITDSYSKIEINNTFTNYYDKTYINTSLDLKRNILDSYSKIDIDTKINK